MNTGILNIEKKRYRLRVVIPAFPAFNVYSHIAKCTTALGPVTVATAARQVPGWDVEVIDENNLGLYGRHAADGGADHTVLEDFRSAEIVGFYGGLTSTIPRLYQLAGFYKERGAVTVAGGQHFVKENIETALRSGIDYIVLGEGEETIQELLLALEGKKNLTEVRGIAYLKDGRVFFTPEREPLTDFDKLPIPDFSLVRYAKMKLFPVGRIRGCGMDCEFCTVKGKPRCASPERLLESIRIAVETFDARHFFIVDDLFGQFRTETIRFCRILKDYQRQIRRRLDFTVQIRLDKAHDSELLSVMRKAGINTVAIGFESPIAEELESMNKRIKPQAMMTLARTYHRFGFLVHGMFIFGYPLRSGYPARISTKERIKRYKGFIKRAKIDTIQVLLPVPLPGTVLRKRLAEQNRLYPKEDIGWEYYDGNFPLFEPDKPLTAEELQSSMHRIMSKFYKFRYMFRLGLNVITFPALIFFLHNIKAGWRKWYRSWRNDLARFGGWIILKRWLSEFRKGEFLIKLKKAQYDLKHHKRIT